MKRLRIVVELDLGVVEDDFDVGINAVETLIRIQELVTVPYTTFELRAVDLDTNLITDLVVPSED
tara:strand:+ start:30349 stop:30543 length:195 start_codon:yes stop_codon:yes gene_type:complete